MASDLKSVKEVNNRDPLQSLAQASINMPPLSGQGMEDDLTQTMFWRLHQSMYQHILSCGMTKTAELFLQESKFFPTLQNHEFHSDSIAEGTLTKAWKNYYLTKQLTTMVVDQKTEPEKTTRSHEKRHSSDKLFLCEYEDCGKSFSRKYDLKVHMRTHTKEKPYLCSYIDCGKRFGRISSVREHERNVHGGIHTTKKQTSSLKCSKCRKDFSTEDELNTHKHVVHGVCNHNHKHTSVFHEGHTDFLIPDEHGVARLHHFHAGVLQQHSLKASSLNPVVCAPVTTTVGHTHDLSHTHGPGCGHEAILHEDHIDYLVDNILHHHHGDHCDIHGNLQILPFDESMEELLNSSHSWDNCVFSSAKEQK